MKATLNALHHHDSDWQRELDFYVEELAILTKRLAEFTSKYSSKEEPKYFEDKFIALRGRIDALKQDIKTREQKIETRAEGAPDTIGDTINVANDRIFDRMLALANNLAATRYEFNQYLSKIL